MKRTLTVAAILVVSAVFLKGETSPSLSIIEPGTDHSPALTPNLSYSLDLFSNLSGGAETGHTANGLVELGFDLDLETLVNWQGAIFSLSAFAGHGNDFSTDRVGDLGVISNTFTDTRFNFFRIQLVQKLGDSGSFLKLGQIAADDDFTGVSTAELFINSSFGPFNTLSANTGTPIFPLAAPGAVLHLVANENFSITTGIYAGFAGDGGPNDRGFDSEFGGDAGYALFGQVNYSYQSGGLSLGGYYHTGDFEDFSDGDTVSGLSALWVTVDHTFIDGEQSGASSLKAFARASVTTQRSRTVAPLQLDSGFVMSDLFIDGDELGLACSYTEFGNANLSGNVEAGVTNSETVLELTYHISVHENFSIQPDIQYILDPHFSGDDAIVFGLRSQITF